VTGSSRPQVDLGRLREVRPGGIALRFVFGAVISVAAAFFAARYGHRFGGLFLAFPAILPASLTLIERKHGDNPASVNAAGAVVGAAARVGFPGAAATAAAAARALASTVGSVANEDAERPASAIDRVWRDELGEVRRDLGLWLRKLAVEHSWIAKYCEFSCGLKDDGRDPRRLP